MDLQINLRFFKRTAWQCLPWFVSLLMMLSAVSSVYADTPLGTIGQGNPAGLGGYADAIGKDEVTQSKRFEDIISNIVGFLTILTGLYFLIYFILGAMSWITSGGEQNKLETARNKMTNATIGVVIVVAAYSITYILGQILGLDILQPSSILPQLDPTP